MSSAEPSESHMSSHSHQESLQRNASSSFPKGQSSNKTAAPQAEEEVFKGQGHVETEQTGQQGPRFWDSAWVVLLSSAAKM